MSKKRKVDSTIFEEIENSKQDDLFEILYKTGSSSNFPKVWDIFNKPLNLKSLLDRFQRKLADLTEVFAESTTFGYIKEFVHFDDLVILSGVKRVCATRRLQSLGFGFSKIERDYKYHPSCVCSMVEQNVAFLVFLSWMEILGT